MIGGGKDKKIREGGEGWIERERRDRTEGMGGTMELGEEGI